MKYTLGFIYCEDTEEVLLLNRIKHPWMGRWNGVGGKLEIGESPLACIIRETSEETGLDIDTYVSTGTLHWDVKNYGKVPILYPVLESEKPVYEEVDGLYLFVGRVTKAQRQHYTTPVALVEGILDWKPLHWIIDDNNVGVVDNIRLFMKDILAGEPTDKYSVVYRNNILVAYTKA